MTEALSRGANVATLVILLVVITGSVTAACAQTTRVYESSVTLPAEFLPEFKTDPWVQESQGNQISGVVRVMHQDARGWYWFGTQNGLARFDGTALVYFDLLDVHDQGIVVRAIAEGRDGAMWFGSSGGVTLYDGETFTTWTEQDGLVSNDVWSLFVDDANELWIGTIAGASRFDGKRFTHVPLPPGEKDPGRQVTSTTMVRAIDQDGAGRIWFAGEGRVHRYDGRTVETLDVTNSTSATFVDSLLPDESGGMWLSAGAKGLLHFDGEEFTTVFERDGVPVGNLHRDAAGSLWFTSHGVGPCRYDGDALTNLASPDGLERHVPFTIAEDDRGRLWFVGMGGVSRYDGETVVNVTREGPW